MVNGQRETTGQILEQPLRYNTDVWEETNTTSMGPHHWGVQKNSFDRINKNKLFNKTSFKQENQVSSK